MLAVIRSPSSLRWPVPYVSARPDALAEPDWPAAGRKLAGAREHRVDHRLGQAPSERVLLAWVVAAEQRVALAAVLGPVGEPRPWTPRRR